MKYIVLFLCAVSHILHCSSNSRNLDAFDAYDQSADSNKRESSNNPAVSKAKGFSGLYEPPKVGTEFYAGAWLAPKKRLLFSADNIAKITNLEGASFHLVLTAPGMNVLCFRSICSQLMTVFIIATLTLLWHIGSIHTVQLSRNDKGMIYITALV